jgi:hypothetical protein
MRTLYFGSLVLVLLVVAGCGGSSGPELYPATGVVTYQSKPVAGATVTFIPEGKATFASAITDTDGKFDLRTGADRGVVAGKAAVTVTWFASSGSGPATSMTPEQMQQMQMSGQLTEQLEKQNQSLIPERYGQAATSGLSFEVTTGKNEFNIALTD